MKFVDRFSHNEHCRVDAIVDAANGTDLDALGDLPILDDEHHAIIMAIAFAAEHAEEFGAYGFIYANLLKGV